MPADITQEANVNASRLGGTFQHVSWTMAISTLGYGSQLTCRADLDTSIHYLSIWLLTPRSRVLLGKPKGRQLVKKFPALYGNHIHKLPPHVPILCQVDPAHASTSHFLEIHFNIILPSTPESSKCSLSLRFPHRNHLYSAPHPHTCNMPRQSPFDHPENIG